MRKPVLLAAVSAALLLLAGCDWADMGDFGGSARFSEDFHHAYPLKPGGRLSIDNLNGSIEITSWNENSVQIDGTKYAPTLEMRDAIRIEISAQPDAIQIRTVRPSESRGSVGARYFIKVPRQTQLDRISSSNASIRIADVEGGARVKTSNGAVRTENLRGSLDVQTSNGSIEVRSQEGAAILRTSNGRITAEDIRGAFEAVTSNGRISAEIARPEAGRAIRVETSNGRVDLALDREIKSDVRVSTSNGSITLRLPDDAGGRLLAVTTNSTVHTDFDVKSDGPPNKRRLEGLLGSGAGPLFDLSTSNGSIRIVRQ